MDIKTFNKQLKDPAFKDLVNCLSYSAKQYVLYLDLVHSKFEKETKEINGVRLEPIRKIAENALNLFLKRNADSLDGAIINFLTNNPKKKERKKSADN